MGLGSGKNATLAFGSNFIGNEAGKGAANAAFASFVGVDAGRDATSAAFSNFFGFGAGTMNADIDEYIDEWAEVLDTLGIASHPQAVTAGATGANFIGNFAGMNAENAYMSNFFGLGAGSGATNAHYSNFIGQFAGSGAINASFSTFIGADAGSEAENAENSLFIGSSAGTGAVNASNAIFIGLESGFEDVVNNGSSNYSILIGNKTNTGGYSNSIALGAYATNTATNQFMIGSSTTRIEEMIFNGGTGNTCSIVAGTGLSCSSDERLKTNITDLASSTLDTLMNIRTVTYNWNSGVNDKTQIGFIAQNINDYFPELVTQNRDGMLAVNYAGMTPVLVKAIQEMQFQLVTIDDMETSNSFRDALVRWFGNVANGITEFIAGTVRARDQLCIDDVCIDKNQLQNMINNGNMNSQNSSSSDNSSDDAENNSDQEPGNTDGDTESETDEGNDTEAGDSTDTGTDTSSEDTSAVGNEQSENSQETGNSSNSESTNDNSENSTDTSSSESSESDSSTTTE